MTSSDENKLLARCRRGDSDAWEELFDQHYTIAARFVVQLGYNFSREDVEEICQEVFLTVIKSLKHFQGNSRFQTWLFRIAVNKARDHQQRQRAAKRGGGQPNLSLHNDDPTSGPVLDPPAPTSTPDLSLINSEAAALVGQALEQLSDPAREIIELRYFADLSYEEIAQCLNLNPKTVSSRLSKSLDKLANITRSLIAKEQDAFPAFTRRSPHRACQLNDQNDRRLEIGR